jgi:diaminopimelate epimerase
MELEFTKYHGAGNDFILIDNREQDFPKNTINFQRICDRHFGIGADGVILIEKHPDLDFTMLYYNPDGTQSLCGNGSRCGFHFARTLGLAGDDSIFMASDGVHQAKLDNGLIQFNIRPVAGIETLTDGYFLDTGSPHFVKLVDRLDNVDVMSEGKKLRYDPRFSRHNGANVNFAQLLPDRVLMRTYERGVENETLSCGTGTVAVALVVATLGRQSPVTIEARGGVLEVRFEQTASGGFDNIWLCGPALPVFKGSIVV